VTRPSSYSDSSLLVAEGLDLGSSGPGELVDSFNRARKNGIGLLELAQRSSSKPATTCRPDRHRRRQLAGCRRPPSTTRGPGVAVRTAE
jgi:hypothetical protein